MFLNPFQTAADPLSFLNLLQKDDIMDSITKEMQGTIHMMQSEQKSNKILFDKLKYDIQTNINMIKKQHVKNIHETQQFLMLSQSIQDRHKLDEDYKIMIKQLQNHYKILLEQKEIVKDQLLKEEARTDINNYNKGLVKGFMDIFKYSNGRIANKHNQQKKPNQKSRPKMKS